MSTNRPTILLEMWQHGLLSGIWIVLNFLYVVLFAASHSTAEDYKTVVDTSDPIKNYTLSARVISFASIHPDFHHKNYLRNKMARINMKLIFRKTGSK